MRKKKGSKRVPKSRTPNAATEKADQTLMGECKHFPKCNAPICPPDESSDAIWYPDEAICRNELFEHERSVMKEIKKRTRKKDRFFTLEMIRAVNVVRNGIEGLDPDKSSMAEERRWINSRRKLCNVVQSAIELSVPQVASASI